MNSKICILLLGMAACACAAPKPTLLAAPVVTATSSQVIARNYNGFAAPYVAAPVVAAPYVAAPLAAAPYVSAPYVAAAYSPYAAYEPYAPYAAAYQSAVIV